MPWKSEAQRRWGHTAKGRRALGGEKAVREWDKASAGVKLPEKVAVTKARMRGRKRNA